MSLQTAPQPFGGSAEDYKRNSTKRPVLNLLRDTITPLRCTAPYPFHSDTLPFYDIYLEELMDWYIKEAAAHGLTSDLEDFFKIYFDCCAPTNATVIGPVRFYDRINDSEYYDTDHSISYLPYDNTVETGSDTFDPTTSTKARIKDSEVTLYPLYWRDLSSPKLWKYTGAGWGPLDYVSSGTSMGGGRATPYQFNVKNAKFLDWLQFDGLALHPSSRVINDSSSALSNYKLVTIANRTVSGCPVVEYPTWTSSSYVEADAALTSGIAPLSSGNGLVGTTRDGGGYQDQIKTPTIGKTFGDPMYIGANGTATPTSPGTPGNAQIVGHVSSPNHKAIIYSRYNQIRRVLGNINSVQKDNGVTDFSLNFLRPTYPFLVRNGQDQIPRTDGMLSGTQGTLTFIDGMRAKADKVTTDKCVLGQYTALTRDGTPFKVYGINGRSNSAVEEYCLWSGSTVLEIDYNLRPVTSYTTLAPIQDIVFNSSNTNGTKFYIDTKGNTATITPGATTSGSWTEFAFLETPYITGLTGYECVGGGLPAAGHTPPTVSASQCTSGTLNGKNNAYLIHPDSIGYARNVTLDRGLVNRLFSRHGSHRLGREVDPTVPSAKDGGVVSLTPSDLSVDSLSRVYGHYNDNPVLNSNDAIISHEDRLYLTFALSKSGKFYGIYTTPTVATYLGNVGGQTPPVPPMSLSWTYNQTYYIGGGTLNDLFYLQTNLYCTSNGFLTAGNPTTGFTICADAKTTPASAVGGNSFWINPVTVNILSPSYSSVTSVVGDVEILGSNMPFGFSRKSKLLFTVTDNFGLDPKNLSMIAAKEPPLNLINPLYSDSSLIHLYTQDALGVRNENYKDVLANSALGNEEVWILGDPYLTKAAYENRVLNPNLQKTFVCHGLPPINWSISNITSGTVTRAEGNHNKATVNVPNIHTPFYIVTEDGYQEYTNPKCNKHNRKAKRRVKVWPRTLPRRSNESYIYSQNSKTSCTAIQDNYSQLSIIASDSNSFSVSSTAAKLILATEGLQVYAGETVGTYNATLGGTSTQLYVWDVKLAGNTVPKSLTNTTSYDISIDGTTSYPHHWFTSDNSVAIITPNVDDDKKAVLTTVGTGTFWFSVADSADIPWRSSWVTVA